MRNQSLKALFLLSIFCSITALAETPQVKLSPKNLNSCSVCHSGLTGKLKDQVALTRKSVHEKIGDCSICHGGNPETNDKIEAKKPSTGYTGKPDPKKIIEFCGKSGCHVSIINSNKKGPHYESVRQKGRPGCVTCHGSHSIKKSADIEINAKSCLPCHPQEYSEQIVNSITGIRSSIRSSHDSMEYLKKKGLDMTDFNTRYLKVKKSMSHIIHSMSENDMEYGLEIINLRIQNLKILSDIKIKQIERLEMLYLTMLIVGLFIIAVTLGYTIYMFRRRKNETASF